MLVEVALNVGFRLIDLFWSSKAERNRKKVLRRRLLSERFRQGRSLKRLTRATGTTPHDCRRLLSEIGAEGITLKDGSEGWRLPR